MFGRGHVFHSAPKAVVFLALMPPGVTTALRNTHWETIPCPILHHSLALLLILVSGMFGMLGSRCLRNEDIAGSQINRPTQNKQAKSQLKEHVGQKVKKIFYFFAASKQFPIQCYSVFLTGLAAGVKGWGEIDSFRIGSEVLGQCPSVTDGVALARLVPPGLLIHETR